MNSIFNAQAFSFEERTAHMADMYDWHHDNSITIYEVKPRAYDAWNCVAYGCL